jgi:hypothetical protein
VLVVAGGFAALLTCSATPPPSPGSVTVNVTQTAVGVNVCNSACVQNVNIQNISVVNISQAARRPAASPTPRPVRAPVRPRPALAPPIPEPVAYLPPPAPPEPPPIPGLGETVQLMGPPHSTPVLTLASRPTAALRRAPAPSSGQNPGLDSSIPLIEVAILALLLAAWACLLLVRRSIPPSGLLVLDDGFAT